MEKEKKLHCDQCSRGCTISYEDDDEEPEICPFCGAGVYESDDGDEEEDDDHDDED